VAAETRADESSSNTVNQADHGVRQQPAAATIFLVIAALIGAFALIGRATRHKQSVGQSGASRHLQTVHRSPEATRPERQRTPDADQDHTKGHQQLTPEGESDVRGRPDEHSDSYDELLAGLRREVAELQRADEAFRTDSRKPDDSHEL
jgi:type IV secretory pathway VirB10-like protein